MVTKLKTTQVVQYRTAILKAQGNTCAICEAPLHATARKSPALDHCHTNGYLRGVLCLMCNQAEGRVRTWSTRAKGKHTDVEWLQRLVDYLKSQPRYPDLIHPTHKTEDEKRTARNAKARATRARLKKAADGTNG